MSRDKFKRGMDGRRLYTEKELGEILENSKDVYRQKRLEYFRRMFSSLMVVYASAASIGACIAAVYLLFTQSQEESHFYEPQMAHVDYKVNEKTGKSEPVYDQTSFSPTIDETILSESIKDVSVSVTDLRIPQDAINAFFSRHQKVMREQYGMINPSIGTRSEALSKLRFRIGMRSGKIIEAALPMWGNKIVMTRSSGRYNIPMNEVVCLRGALHGAAYQEDVELSLKRAGVKTLPKGLVALAPEECMLDEEAQMLYSMLASLSEDTRFDWGMVVRAITFGVWNPHHPALSILITLLIACVLIYVKKRLAS